MQITFYKSNLCPRCHLAGKALRELAAERGDIELEIVDVLAAPRRTLADGVRMIPAIRAGERLLSALYLSRKTISRFLNEASDS